MSSPNKIPPKWGSSRKYVRTSGAHQQKTERSSLSPNAAYELAQLNEQSRASEQFLAEQIPSVRDSLNELSSETGSESGDASNTDDLSEKITSNSEIESGEEFESSSDEFVIIEREIEDTVDDSVPVGSSGDLTTRETVPHRTRFDLVALAKHFVIAADAATHQVSDELESWIEVVSCPEDPIPDHVREELREAVLEGKKQSVEELGSLMQGLEQRPALSGTDNPNPRAIEKALHTPVTGDEEDSHYVHRAKDEVKNIGKESLAAASGTPSALIDAINENAWLQERPQLQEAMRQRVLAKSKKLKNTVGNVRADIIHNAPEWDQDTASEYTYALKTADGEEKELTHSLRAAGPAYSSAMPRDRNLDDAYAANFFESRLSVDMGNEEVLVMDATRSAVPVEFAQNDAVERARCTEKIIGQITDHHIEKRYEQLAAEHPKGAQLPGSSRKDPLVHKQQFIIYLTPDTARHIGHKAGKVFRADDERLLTQESIEAVRRLDGKVVQREITVNGKKKKVWVKYDMRAWVTPGNSYYQTLQNKSYLRPLLWHKASEKTIKQSLKKLDEDMKKTRIQAYREQTPLRRQLSKKEQAHFDKLDQLTAKKQAARRKITQYVLKKGKPPPERLVKPWQEAADAIAAHHQQVPRLSKAGKQLNASLRKMDAAEDIYADVVEITKGHLQGQLTGLDDTRAALPARITTLGFLLDTGTHGFCRSGKDRTGLVDDENQLHSAESYINGRAPAYFEQKQLPNHRENRRVIHKEGGNAEHNTAANLGGFQWWNLGGAGLKEDDGNKKLLNELQGPAKAYIRPSAKGWRQSRKPRRRKAQS